MASEQVKPGKAMETCTDCGRKAESPAQADAPIGWVCIGVGHDMVWLCRDCYDKPVGDEQSPLTNADRVRHVERIVGVSPWDEYCDPQGRIVDPGDFIVDLLANALHFCDAHRLNGERLLEIAQNHYRNEKAAEGRGGNDPDHSSEER